ncbi:MAG: tRNA (N(6)-L-threonylcarbamoyladenosine(37)-C(2))-methylthiotransferase MtaB [Rhodothermia bacterium]|nr:MAG: tRNA (N(6)-L-threonylcarbamoyladenosine(37)-C(2))-methylthiotransferase MtaB [Rhodothermia bacterium]
MRSVSIHTLGCKLNFAESGTLKKQFQNRQYDVVPFGAPSDVTVINTCTVTEEADRKCRQVVRRAIRSNPETFVVVTGCYAQLQPEEIAAIPGVDAVLGANEKLQLFNYIDAFKKTEKTQVSVSCVDDVNAFGPAYASGDRTRAFLKVQDGCDYVCSFCTIPFARGKSRSAAIDDIVGQAHEIGDAGCKEIVISGVNIGLFGRDTEERLMDLIAALDEVESIERFRISSIEPNLLTDDIIGFVAGSRRFMPHFHMPLQSGDDEILGKMKRRYRSDRYRDRVLKIKGVMPHACIGVDVIVGFPGETDAHFRRTQDFLTDLPVSYLHVFSYSERPLSSASSVVTGFSVPKSERSRRNNVLRLLSERKRTAFYVDNLGTNRTVLWEHSDKKGYQLGFTDNYIRVERASDGVLNELLEMVFLDSVSTSGNVQIGEPEFVTLI